MLRAASTVPSRNLRGHVVLRHEASKGYTIPTVFARRPPYSMPKRFRITQQLRKMSLDDVWSLETTALGLDLYTMSPRNVSVLNVQTALVTPNVLWPEMDHSIFAGELVGTTAKCGKCHRGALARYAPNNAPSVCGTRRWRAEWVVMRIRASKSRNWRKRTGYIAVRLLTFAQTLFLLT